MNIQFQRKVDRIVGTIICRILSLFSRRKSATPATVKADKILVILLSEMGSLVLAYPMFQRLKEKYPDAELYGLLFEKNKEVLDLLKVTDEQNVLTINDKSLRTFIRDSLRVIMQLRKLNADVVIDCELFARISSIFSFISGADIRVGFHGEHVGVAAGSAPCTHSKGMNTSASTPSAPTAHRQDSVVWDVVKRLRTSITSEIIMIFPKCDLVCVR